MRCRHEPRAHKCPWSCMGLSPFSRRISRAASGLGPSEPWSWKPNLLRVKLSCDLTRSTRIVNRTQQRRRYTWQAKPTPRPCGEATSSVSETNLRHETHASSIARPSPHPQPLVLCLSHIKRSVPGSCMGGSNRLAGCSATLRPTETYAES